jgi:hypothetical protein
VLSRGEEASTSPLALHLRINGRARRRRVRDGDGDVRIRWDLVVAAAEARQQRVEEEAKAAILGGAGGIRLPEPETVEQRHRVGLEKLCQQTAKGGKTGKMRQGTYRTSSFLLFFF